MMRGEETLDVERDRRVLLQLLGLGFASLLAGGRLAGCRPGSRGVASSGDGTAAVDLWEQLRGPWRELAFSVQESRSADQERKIKSWVISTLPSYGGSAERLSDLRDGLTVS